MRAPTLFGLLSLTLGCRHGSPEGDDTEETVACEDSGTGSGAAIEEVLSGITGYSRDVVEIDDLSADCLEEQWEITAYTQLRYDTDIAVQAVYLFVWDLADDALLGGWPLSEDQSGGGVTIWTGSLSADEAGVRCDGAGSATFVGLPVAGASIGTYAGVYMGSVEALGFATGETSAVLRAVDHGADSVSWRLHDLLGCEEGATGEMESEGSGDWKATVPWDSDAEYHEGPPLVGAWGSIGGSATGAASL